MHSHKLSKHQDVALISLKQKMGRTMFKIFKEFLNRKNIKRYLQYTSRGAVFDERLNKTIRNLLKSVSFWLEKLG